MATVLVIDDEPMTCWAIERVLGAAGHQVSAAPTGAEGLALFRELRPQVVLLDVRLPDGDGLAVLGHLRNEGGAGTAVIVITAGVGPGTTRAQALRSGAWGYLTKPFHFDDLPIIVTRAVEAAAVACSRDP